DAVSGFGVFASVAMFVFKLYHVLMPIVERRLMVRNGGVVEAAGDNIQQTLTVENSATITLQLPTNDAHHHSRNQMRIASKSNHEDHNGRQHRPQRHQEQFEALRRLIVTITENHYLC
ncbi:transmembrane protein, putative, partial [Bodo saltans]